MVPEYLGKCAEKRRDRLLAQDDTGAVHGYLQRVLLNGHAEPVCA
jgi:hypothetical protein